MSSPRSARYFSGSYAEARDKFLRAASGQGAQTESFMHDKAGALGEALATDVARIGQPDATNLLILSSGTHGPEGFAGSACQLAALDDADLLARLKDADAALLLVHAINPYGFSWLHRTNEDNVDLNRNFIAFDAPLPSNPEYLGVEALFLPTEWPPSPESRAALGAFLKQHGPRQVNAALAKGQYESPNGLFYGGQRPAWSNNTVRSILRQYAGAARRIAWIDVHTGLGPYGHGEKIFPGKLEEAPLAKSWWGADLMVVAANQSVSAGAKGPMLKCIYEECPSAQVALMGLEFGTLPHEEVLEALRADAWMRSHPDAPAALRQEIGQQLRGAFYCDNDEWKGMVLGQSRVILLQTISGMRDAGKAIA
jgi:hypothetical protein